MRAGCTVHVERLSGAVLAPKLRYDRMMSGEPELVITSPERVLDPTVEERLREELGRCRDLAFAHLPQVLVPGRQQAPELVLFVWLVPPALRSLRFALNLVSEAVARVLPDGDYLDVVVLNSAPELLDPVERAGALFVENDPEERGRALAAAAAREDATESDRRPWWRF